MIARNVPRILLVTLMFFLLPYAVSAQQTYEIDCRDTPLSDVLKKVTEMTGYSFVYSNTSVDVSAKTDVSVRSSDINVILDSIFKNTGIVYTIVGRQVALRTENAVPQTPAQTPSKGTRTVRGQVLDDSDLPLVGADVFIKGTTTGVFTDSEGRYEIEVPDDPETELVFNFFGMKTRAERIGARSRIDMLLLPDAKFIDEVVVTGYQTISRERSAGAFAKVEGETVSRKSSAFGSPLRGLEGTVAGLNVNTSSEGTTYLIRGVTSINASTEPLYIVDGVAMSRDQLETMVNPNDISSVTFLKDATAASIWGAQAANGVIVLTTKTGTGTGKLTVSYNGSFTFKGKPDYGYNDMMTASEFISAASEVFDPYTYPYSDVSTMTWGISGNFPVVYPHEIPMYRYFSGEISYAEREAALSALASQDGRGDYEKYMMSNAFLTDHSVSFSGGNDRNNYYVSLGYQGEQGTAKDRSDEYKIFMRDMLSVTKWLKLDISLNAYWSKATSHLSSGDDEGMDHLTSLPYAVFYNDDGSPISFTQYLMMPSQQSSTEDITGINLDYYPVTDWLSSTVSDIEYSVRANAGVTVKLFPFLSYEGRFQYLRSSTKSESFYPADSFKVRIDRAYATDTEGTAWLPSSGGNFTMGDSYTDSYTVRNQLNFDHSWQKTMKHQITAVAGFEIRDTRTAGHTSFMRGYDMQTMQHIEYDDYYLSTTGVRNPVLPMLAGAAANYFDPNSYDQTETEYRFMSVYANASYTLADKYSLNASIRVDQSNLFGSDPSVQFKPIWSVGGIWNIARENFLVHSTWIDNLNLRVSYGFAGNSPDPGQGGPYDILSSASDPSYSEFGLGYTVTTPANDKLTWEKTRTWNVGIDFDLFSRLSGSVDFYDKYTTNLLASTPADPTTGFVSVLSNVGEMSNRGVELSLNSINIVNAHLLWTTGFNFTYNANKLVSMYVNPPDTPNLMVDYEYWEGYPYGTLFGYRWAGLDPANGMSRVYNSRAEAVSSVSDIDDLSVVPYLGTTVPPFYGSLTNTFRIHDFELSFMFVYNMGHKMRNDINTQYTYRLNGALHKDFALRWKQPGDEAFTDVPAYYRLDDTSVNETDILSLYRYADINVLDASYIKLRDLSIAYYLPEKACKAIAAQSASVRFQVSDLFVIPFNGEGIDPEAFSLRYGSRGDKFRPMMTLGLSIDF